MEKLVYERDTKLIVAAPPRAPAELRQLFHADVKKRIIAEIDKDLTKHPVAEIEKHLVTDYAARAGSTGDQRQSFTSGMSSPRLRI